MILLEAIIIGGIIGWLAGRVMGRHEGVLASVVIGIVGSLIGGVLSNWAVGQSRAVLAFSWSGLLWSFIGAIILVAILNAVSSRHHHHTPTY